MAYKKLIKVSNVCQILDKSKYPATNTDRGITFTNNGDGSITVNGTATGEYYSLYTINVNLDSVIHGHIYAILGTGTNIQTVIIGNYVGGYIFENSNSIYTFPNHEYNRIVYEIRAILGVNFSNVMIKPQLFDLTEMYGAGHEPTSVEQFRQDFPEEMYDYSPYCWLTSYKRVFMTGEGKYLTSYKTSLVCKTKNLFDIPLIQGYPSNTNFDNSTKRTFTIGTYIVGLTRNNYYSEYYIKNVNVSKNRISFKLIGGWYGVSIPCLLTVGKTYTFSCKTDKNYSTNIGISYYKENGELISYTDDSGNNHKIVKSFTVPENTYYTLILFTGAYGDEYTYYDIQLELGNTATDYVPYGHL